VTAPQQQLQAPPIYAGALESLARLDKSAFESLVAICSADPPVLRRSDVVEQSATVLGLDDRDTASMMVSAAMTLMPAASSLSITIAEAADGVSRADNLALDESERSTLAERLAMLVETPSISHLGHALDLRAEETSLFLSGRILTDLRPLFGDDATTVPQTGIITQTLSIRYVEDGVAHTLHLSVDAEDLKRMADMVTRAITKAETLARVCDGSGISLIDTAE
jgi:hypothetical protein